MVTTRLSKADSSLDGSPADLPFHIEQHGIDFVPAHERWGRPRDLAGMWAGASVNVEYLVYGAILMGFGFSFTQTIILIVLGNLSWMLVGLCSLQGPLTGTTVFGINRAPYGPRGSKLPSFFNWLTMIGFEVEGLILIVGATMVLLTKAGVHQTTTTKVLVVIGAVAVQAVLPVFGHATMVKVLKIMIAPFVVSFLGLLAFSWNHLGAHASPTGPVSWQLWTVGLAFSITLSGLGWTECGNDYSRYLDAGAPRGKIVGWVFTATALPQILIMVLGASLLGVLGSAATWNGANPFAGFTHTTVLPSWFVVVFLVFVIIQLFGINSLDLYSSGVTLQALGLRLRRSHAVLLDSVIVLGITLWAVLDSSFSTYLKDFVGLVIIWIAPWCAIVLVDWVLRRFSYSPPDLQLTDARSLYWGNGGFNLPALAAQVLGMCAALSALNTPFSLPDWLHPLTVVTEADAHAGALSGADFSVFLGLGVGGLSYFVLASMTGMIKKQTAAHPNLMASVERMPAS